ncbi:MAG: TAXI family TRAP transporter solute-binding subunit [Deltaproteobacteria bacterium]|nr:TAXI family TRAP transporter solute-binding subunit [Deltaproteobacteria bacterium]
MVRLFAAVLLAAACTAGPALPSSAERLLTLGAAPLGGTYYPAGIAIADIITKYVPDTDVRVEVTGGTMENPALMQQGELQLGLANADAAFFAYTGKPPFKAPLGDLRALFVGLAPGVVQYAVLGDSGIATVKDLAGKRVAVGPQGNSSGLLFAKILNFYGLGVDDVTRSFVSFADGVSELVDGHVDMAIVQAGLPAPGLQEAFTSRKNIRILSLPDKERDAFLREYPYYIPVTIPKGTYSGMVEDVTTLATQNMVLVHASLSEDLVYAITKAVFEHLPDLYTAHPSLRSVTLETAANSPIPLHEGARRYFREMGVMP